MREILSGLDEHDVLIAVSLLLLAAGTGMVYLPLALIVPGALMFLVIVWPEKRGK